MVDSQHRRQLIFPLVMRTRSLSIEHGFFSYICSESAQLVSAVERDPRSRRTRKWAVTGLG